MYLSEGLLKQIIFNIPNYVFWKDEALAYQGCNYNFARVVGLNKPEDIIGKNDFDMPWGEYTAYIYQEEDRAILSTGQAIVNREVPMVIGKDETTQILSVSKAPLYNEANQIIGILGIYHDITEQKRAEKLSIEKKAAEELVSLLKTLGGSMAHELRTPLAAIRMTYEGLLRSFPHLLEAYEATLNGRPIKTPLTTPQLNYLKQWGDSCQPILDSAQITLDMFLMNIRQSGLDESHFFPCLISKAIHIAIDGYPFFDAQQRTLVHWENKKDFRYYGDQRLTKHILWNLIKNALYYIKAEHKGEINIWLETGQEANYLHFKDTACGIPAKRAEKIFDSFYTTRKSGTGLGLAFCKLVMEAYCGDIRCEAKEGEFTHFILQFPVVEPTSSEKN